jgi:hypothetical protein
MKKKTLSREELFEQFFTDAGMKYKVHGAHGVYYDVGPSSGEEFVVDLTPESDFYRRSFVKGDIVVSVRPPFRVDTKWETNFFLNLHNPEFFSRLKKILQGN